MKITPAVIILPIVSLLVGGTLIYVGIYRHWGAVWTSGGVFFAALGAGAQILTLAWSLPGRAGRILRHPAAPTNSSPKIPMIRSAGSVVS